MKTSSLPPGPRSALPQLLHFNDPFPYMLALAREHADPLTCPILGAGPMVITWSPEGARAVFTADPDVFEPGANEALAVMVGSGSIFLKSGADHRRARRLLAPPFHGERMRAWGELMRDATRRHAPALPAAAPGPLLPVAQRITLDIIIEAVFGERDPARVAQLHDDILALVAAFNPVIATFRAMQREFGGVGPWARFRRRADAVHGRMRALIAEKRERPGDDVLSLLLATRDEDGAALPESELLDQLLTFVVAGHETTATSLAWAVYELLRAPEALAALRDELDAGDGSAESLARAPLLGGACDETLRLHPPVPVVPRKLARPLTLGAFELPAGTTVGVGVYMAHHRAETFASPADFVPSRFVGRSYTPFEFMPFGGGARRCLGAAFASYELRVVLGTLLRETELTLAEPRPVPNAFRVGTYGPATGVRVTAAPRGQRTKR